MEKFIGPTDCIIHYVSPTSKIDTTTTNLETLCPKKKKFKKSEESQTIKPKYLASWTSLLEAAKTRKYTVLLNYEETTNPSILYHLRCRKLFTMKRDLDKLKLESVKAI